MELIELNIKIGQLFDFLADNRELNNDLYEELQVSKSQIYILNLDNEIVPINAYIKKHVNLHTYTFESGKTLTCSNKHIVLNANNENILIKDTNEVQSLDGIEYIVNDKDLGDGVAYDISIPAPHLYYTTNGIIHHNTTISRIMANYASDVLTINASNERGIDTVREKVISFASSNSLFGGKQQLKAIILEECDGFTPDAWSALRATIEQFYSTTRFIANCNYIEKIPDPIKSRFNCVAIEPQNAEEEAYLLKGYIERAGRILAACGIKYKQEVLEAFVKIDFPDMRSIIKKIQQMHTRGDQELTMDAVSRTFNCSDLFNIILSAPNPLNNYKSLMGEWASRCDDAILQIGKQLPNYIMTKCPDKISKLPLIVITTAEYQAQLPNAIDKFVVLSALVFKLQMILNQ